MLPVREGTGVAEGSEALFRDVTQKVADIEGRIALAVEVEVEQEEAPVVHDDLVGVEVPVDPARRRLRRRRTEPVGSVEKPRDSSPPKRSGGSDGREARLQDVQLVSHRVTALGRHLRPMELARRLRDLPGDRDTCRCRQEVGRRTAVDLALQPHPEYRNGADWLWN